MFTKSNVLRVGKMGVEASCKGVGIDCRGATYWGSRYTGVSCFELELYSEEVHVILGLLSLS